MEAVETIRHRRGLEILQYECQSQLVDTERRIRLRVFRSIRIHQLLVLDLQSDEDTRIAQANASIDDLSLTLTRTACFGTCPIYSLSVTRDGTARFAGVAYTDTEGVAETRLSAAQLSEFVKEIVRADFFGYKQDDQCVVFKTDHPSVILKVLWHGRKRSADVILGCEKRLPDPIPALVDSIDKIVNIMQWIGYTEKEWR
jgi:hypothetical protein